MTPEVIQGLVSTLGVGGALVWYLYHNTTKTIPDLNEANKKAILDLTEMHTKTNEAIASNFSETLKEERAYRREEIDSLKHWIKTEATCRYNRENPQA